MYKIKVHTGNEISDFTVEDDRKLLVQLREHGIFPESPCNGNGTCGKCRIKVISGKLPEPAANEVKLLGMPAVLSGWRLACMLPVLSDLEIVAEAGSSQAKIVTGGKQRAIGLKPLVEKSAVQLGHPGLINQTADCERINSLISSSEGGGLELVRKVPELLRKSDFNVTLVKSGSRLLDVEAGDTGQSLYGVAVDIGTTTIASYLVDLLTGKKLYVNSLLNPQKIFGADVISRIKHTMDNGPAGLEELHRLITDAINASIAVLCSQAGIAPPGIHAVTLVGNTTMLHLLLKVSPRYIATAPFVPAFTSKMLLQAKDLGISINPLGLVCVLPSVSAYIGADTVAAVLSAGMFRQKAPSLLIDIGTNGEIVLGGETGLFACSSAAGPAFEGANIRDGMGSITGAISSVSLARGLSCKTIGNSRPAGICGTGMVDLLAQLLETGIIDETGRIAAGWKAVLPAQKELEDRITTIDGMNAFVVCPAGQTLSGREIVLTQKDVRELQNAKAAIAAGINVLVKEAGIGFEDISEVYLAGGFGSYMDIGSALKIGLIPPALSGKISAVGNAAGQGAIEALMNRDCLKLADEISKNMKYIELSASKDFNDYYVDCMMFGE